MCGRSSCGWKTLLTRTSRSGRLWSSRKLAQVLRDEGIAYAEKLKAAGVAVTHLHAPDMGHNFPVTPSQVVRFPQSVQTLGEIAEWLKANLVGR